MSDASTSSVITPRAWRSSAAHAFFWFVAAVTVILDLVTKAWAFKVLKPNEIVDIIPGLLQFRIVNNPGAVFGFGAGLRWLFVGASVAAMIFILQLFSQCRPRQRAFQLFLALVLGGALGNLYDRILYGKVRDFIFLTLNISGKDIWPWIFNIADVALVVGVFGLLLGWQRRWFEIGGSLPVARPLSAEPCSNPCSCSPESHESK